MGWTISQNALLCLPRNGSFPDNRGISQSAATSAGRASINQTGQVFRQPSVVVVEWAQDGFSKELISEAPLPTDNGEPALLQRKILDWSVPCVVGSFLIGINYWVETLSMSRCLELPSRHLGLPLLPIKHYRCSFRAVGYNHLKGKFSRPLSNRGVMMSATVMESRAIARHVIIP